MGVRDPLLPLNGFFSISLEIKKPLKIEQKQLWKYYLGKNYFYDIDNEISKLVSQFNLNASSILATTRESILFAKAGDMSSLAQVLWDTSRAITRPKMAEFAQLDYSQAKHRLLGPTEKRKTITSGNCYSCSTTNQSL